MWSADGKMLFYMSDATGAENIWAVPVASPESAKELTRFREGRVLWPSGSCWRAMREDAWAVMIEIAFTSQRLNIRLSFISFT
jgi:hypothetical protein